MKFCLSLLCTIIALVLLGCGFAEMDSPVVGEVRQVPAVASEEEQVEDRQPLAAQGESEQSAADSHFGEGILMGMMGPAVDADGLPFIPRLADAQAFVAEVVDVPPGHWTNGNPPTLQINVIDALGGDMPLGPNTAIWDNPLLLLCGVGAEEAIARWNATPLALPKKGSRWIIYGKKPSGLRLPDSEALRIKVRNSLDRKARN